MFLYIVRHGHPVYGPKEQLTETGRKQARALVPRMVRAGITRIYSSPLRRAIEKLLENDLAELLLSGTFKAGDTISVRKGKAEDKLDFVKKERTANTRREAAVHGK